MSQQQPRRYILRTLSLPDAMPAFAVRFVGQAALPPRSSDFDLDQFFSLTSQDVAASGRRGRRCNARERPN